MPYVKVRDEALIQYTLSKVLNQTQDEELAELVLKSACVFDPNARSDYENRMYAPES